MIAEPLANAVQRALGARVTAARRVSGGSINETFVIELEGRGSAFLKTHAKLAASVFADEASGLEWLRETSTVNVPKVLAVAHEAPGFLLLQCVAPARGAPREGEERFGRALAGMHRFGAPSFGLGRPNYLAILPQDNTPCDSWATFYRDRRLAPLLEKARARGLVSARLDRMMARLLERIDSLVGPVEPPARLHGDLWGGNRIVGQDGESWLIDPAVYGGHREIDLAMMRLFGGFSEQVFAAYCEAFPLAQGHEARVPLHQLYPLLAHVVMFGGGYVSQVEEAAAALV